MQRMRLIGRLVLLDLLQRERGSASDRFSIKLDSPISEGLNCCCPSILKWRESGS